MKNILKTKLKFQLLILFLCVLCSCIKTMKSGHIEQIRFEESISKTLNLSEIADSVKFTFLEYDNNNLVGQITKFKISNHYILIADQQHKFFVFNKDGDLISTIYKRGKGPSEYITIEDFILDTEENNIFILDPNGGKIIKFNIKGDFVKEYSIPFTHATHIGILANNNFILYQSARFSDEHFNVFIFDNDFHLIKSIKDYGGKHLKELPYLMDICWYESKNDIYYKEVFTDTIFTIDGKNILKPQLIIEFGKLKMPFKFYTKTSYYQQEADKFYQLVNLVESQKFSFFQIFFNNESKFFLYEKRDKKLLDLGNKALINYPHINRSFWPEYIDNNEIMYVFIDHFDLKNILNFNCVSDKFLQGYNLNDNPVLISSKLKAN